VAPVAVWRQAAVLPPSAAWRNDLTHQDNWNTKSDSFNYGRLCKLSDVENLAVKIQRKERQAGSQTIRNV